MGEDMIENRRVRFANVEKLDRVELGFACEIWLDDLVGAPWASREAMKLGAHLMNYIRGANPANLQLREMEMVLQLTREELNRAFNLLKLFGALTAYTVDKDDVRASLVLSPMQVLQMLELRARFMALAGSGLSETFPHPVLVPVAA
jgi:hypothetical protein